MMMLMMDLQVRLFVARRGVSMGEGLDDIGHYYYDYYYQQYWENEGVKGIGTGHKSGSGYKRPGEAARTMSGL